MRFKLAAVALLLGALCSAQTIITGPGAPPPSTAKSWVYLSTVATAGHCAQFSGGATIGDAGSPCANIRTASDVVSLFGSGCSGYLRFDGSCGNPGINFVGTTPVDAAIVSYNASGGGAQDSGWTASAAGGLACPSCSGATQQIWSAGSAPSTDPGSGNYTLFLDASTVTLKAYTHAGTVVSVAAALQDPGSNGIVKRTATNTTAIATAGTDYVGPVASGALALATTAIAAGACQAVTAGSVNSAAATGALTTDAISWTPNGSIKAVTGFVPGTTGGLSIVAYPTAGYVNFDVCNWSSASITPGAVTLNWKVVR